jgi:hypothetical protein
VAVDLAKIEKRYEREKRRWNRYTSLWQDAYDHVLPQRDRFSAMEGASSEGDRRGVTLFDSTGEVSTQQFASRLKAGVMPPFVRWFELKAGPAVPKEQRAKLNEQLEEVTETVHEILRNSNLDGQTDECFLDLAIGTANLLVEEGDLEKPIDFQAVPLTNCVLLRGPKGDHDGVVRVQTGVPVETLPITYPTADLGSDMRQMIEATPDKEIEIIHATWKDHSRKDTDVYQYVCWVKNPKVQLLEYTYEGQGSNPWITFRWAKASGELYGRGPVMHALADIKTVNFIVEMTLENAEFAVGGMYNIDDDGTLNVDNIQFTPRMLIPRAPGSKGMEAIQNPGRFDVSNLIVDKLQAAIKRALFDEMLGPPEGTPMSATEVRERQADMARRIGSPYMRLQVEFIQPLIQRVIYILTKRGLVKLPRVNGREVKISAVSPLAKAQEQEDVRNADVWLEMTAARFGPQMVSAMVKGTEYASWTADKLGIPKKFVRTEAEAEKFLTRLQQIATMQQAPQRPA